MKINRFMSQIDTMARQNQFEVEVFQPSLSLRIRGMRCQKVSLPNKTLATNPYSVVPSGPAENMVTQVQYPQEVTLDFILDSSFEDRAKIELWQQHIFNDDYSIKYPKGISGLGTDGYLGTVVIRQLSRDGLPIYEVQLNDAFPSIISGLSFDMESSAVQTFTTTFSYRTWESHFENVPPGSILGALFQKGVKKLKSRVRKKAEDEIFKEGRTSFSRRRGLGD